VGPRLNSVRQIILAYILIRWRFIFSLKTPTMIIHWSYEGMIFPFLFIWLLSYTFRSSGSSWQKRHKKRARNRKAGDVRPSRWTLTNQNNHPPPRIEAYQKTKRGLRGFANGHSTAGIADTGAAHNVVSLTFSQSLGLDIRPSNHKFQLGSSKQIMSLGKSFLQPVASPKPH
jgi:predicted aspartyl protease